MMLDKEDAQIIAAKFNGVIEQKNRAHDLVKIYYKGIRVASFGIRHGSKKSEGHDHIPKDIHWSPHKCKECAQCKYGFDDWVRDMIAKGIITA